MSAHNRPGPSVLVLIFENKMGKATGRAPRPLGLATQMPAVRPHYTKPTISRMKSTSTSGRRGPTREDPRPPGPAPSTHQGQPLLPLLELLRSLFLPRQNGPIHIFLSSPLLLPTSPTQNDGFYCHLGSQV